MASLDKHNYVNHLCMFCMWSIRIASVGRKRQDDVGDTIDATNIVIIISVTVIAILLAIIVVFLAIITMNRKKNGKGATAASNHTAKPKDSKKTIGMKGIININPTHLDLKGNKLKGINTSSHSPTISISTLKVRIDSDHFKSKKHKRNKKNKNIATNKKSRNTNSMNSNNNDNDDNIYDVFGDIIDISHLEDRGTQLSPNLNLNAFPSPSIESQSGMQQRFDSLVGPSHFKHTKGLQAVIPSGTPSLGSVSNSKQNSNQNSRDQSQGDEMPPHDIIRVATGDTNGSNLDGEFDIGPSINVEAAQSVKKNINYINNVNKNDDGGAYVDNNHDGNSSINSSDDDSSNSDLYNKKDDDDDERERTPGANIKAYGHSPGLYSVESVPRGRNNDNTLEEKQVDPTDDNKNDNEGPIYNTNDNISGVRVNWKHSKKISIMSGQSEGVVKRGIEPNGYDLASPKYVQIEGFDSKGASKGDTNQIYDPSFKTPRNRDNRTKGNLKITNRRNNDNHN